MPKSVFDPFDTDRFGNLDANVSFLEAEGLLGGSLRVLEIGSGRGTLLALLRARGLRRRIRAMGIIWMVVMRPPRR